MNIVLASDDQFVRHLAVTVISILQNNQRGGRICFYVLSLNISQDNQQKLHDMILSYDSEIMFIEIQSIQSYYDFSIDTGRFQPIVLSRLFIARLLPTTIDRVLYLDCDTVINGPIDALYHISLDGAVIGMAIEPTVGSVIKNPIRFAAEDVYYNAGVLLIDLVRWRAKNIEDALLHYYAQKHGKLLCNDQDLLNVVLKGRIKPLDPKYNFYTTFKYHRHSTLVKQLPAYGQFSKKEYNAAKRQPIIVHFLGAERPWLRGNLNPYRHLYDRYLAMTPWRGTPRLKGREIYLFLFHIMEWLTILCPPFRAWISQNWGMKVK